MSTRFACAWGTIASTLLVAAVIGGGSPASAQTSFSYQGQLKSTGAPYNGTADLRFTLYTAASGGSVVGAPVSVINITATDGLVSTALDFGAVAFNGSPRWLQIEVKTPSTGGAGPYTALTPRQPVNPAPYSMYAHNASISGPQPNSVSFSNAANAFTGSGAGLMSLNASGISTGTLNVARLPTGGSWSLGSKLSVDGGTLTVDQANNLVGINNEFPQFPLHIVSTAFGLFHGDGQRALATFIDASGGYFGTYSNHPLHFFTNNGNAQATLTSAGDLGVGTITPNGRLQIQGGPLWTSDGWLKGLHIGNAHALEMATPSTKFGIGATSGLGAPSLYFFHTATDGASAPNYYMVHTNSGQVGIGATSVGSEFKLSVHQAGFGHQAIRGDAPNGHGVVGTSQSTPHYGVSGVNYAANGVGIYAEDVAIDGVGLYAQGGPFGSAIEAHAADEGLDWAIRSFGSVQILGDLVVAGEKNFRIDHPLDPENKYLYHHCTEGADPLNVYSGTVIADGLGQAQVELPAYFEAINRDPRYQLTAIGAPAPNLHIAEEIINNTFMIAGAAPGMKVSWRIEAVRNDRWVQTHGIRVEVDKPAHLRGKYQHPELYGLGDEYAELPRNRPSPVAPIPAD